MNTHIQPLITDTLVYKHTQKYIILKRRKDKQRGRMLPHTKAPSLIKVEAAASSLMEVEASSLMETCGADDSVKYNTKNWRKDGE